MEISFRVEVYDGIGARRLESMGSRDLGAEVLSQQLSASSSRHDRCFLCPRNCNIDRRTTVGPCGIGPTARISTSGARWGEERFLSGRRGSGMMFLSGCTHACVFCQNYDINLVRGAGCEISVRELADEMLRLQSLGCHNIHWVSPTQQLPWLVPALEMARAEGLRLPLVYNTGGYESVEVLHELDGLVDIYLPDFKFFDETLASRYVRLHEYPKHTMQAIVEMKRQVGDLQLDASGMAVKGLVVRHLVMPGLVEDARRIYEWIYHNLGPQTLVNIMPQYRPEYRSSRFEEIAMRTPRKEWLEAVDIARQIGLANLYQYAIREAPLPTRPVPVTVARR